MSDEVRDPFGGGGPPIAKFVDIGDSVEGKIVKTEHKAQTDTDGNIKRFEDGTPRPVVIVFLVTPDGEEMRDFVQGRSVTEFRHAVHAVEGEGQGPKAGAYYKRTLTGRGKPKSAGRSGENFFDVEYRHDDEKELV